MEQDSRFPTGEWNGFYLENHRSQRGWMHLYLEFKDGLIRGEGTDYVGPWTAAGTYDATSGTCQWTKQYVGKHKVEYDGRCSSNGILGQWRIVVNSGNFHIWPKENGELTELYLREDLSQLPPSIQLGAVPTEEFGSFV
jgi:hypothetical protein